MFQFFDICHSSLFFGFQPGVWQDSSLSNQNSRESFLCVVLVPDNPSGPRSKSRCHFKVEREHHTFDLLNWKIFNTIKYLAKISDVAKVGNGHDGSMFDVD